MSITAGRSPGATTIRPFTVEIPEAEIEALRARIGVVPTAVSIFPDELYQAPRAWAGPACPDLIYFNQVEEGNHFAAWQEPGIFTTEVRAAYRSLR